jgi:hypothetical protein
MPEAYSRGRSASESSDSILTYEERDEDIEMADEIPSLSQRSISSSSSEDSQSTNGGPRRKATKPANFGRWKGLLDVLTSGDAGVNSYRPNPASKEGDFMGQSAGKGSQKPKLTSQGAYVEGLSSRHRGKSEYHAGKQDTGGQDPASIEEADSSGSTGADSLHSGSSVEANNEWFSKFSGCSSTYEGEVLDYGESDEDSIPALTTRQYSSDESFSPVADHNCARTDQRVWTWGDAEDEGSSTLGDSMPSLEPVYRREGQSSSPERSKHDVVTQTTDVPADRLVISQTKNG